MYTEINSKPLKGDLKMCEKVFDQSIGLKQYLSEKEYKEINQLKEICSLKDKTNLKLELDYKLNIHKHSEIGLKNINEFFYYVEGVLVAYIGISSFGNNTAEINGMTHPDWRRKGIFKKLFELAIQECQKRNFNKILLLADRNSISGLEFIKVNGGNYSFSEYRMKRLGEYTEKNINSIYLREAKKHDKDEIARQDAMFFGKGEQYESFLEEGENPSEITYMIELKGEIIGKIRVEYGDNSAFIYGFGIISEFRGKGYGKATLRTVLKLINEKDIYSIELDVECKNDTALNLYKACGFQEKSVMDYYIV